MLSSSQSVSQQSIFYLRISQTINCRSSSSNLRHMSIVDLLSVFDIDLIFTMFISLSVETSLDKEKNRSHTHIKSSISNKQINIQNIKQKKFEFRFAPLLLQWVCFNEILLASLLQQSQWVRYNDIKSACVVFFDSLHLRSQYITRRWIYYITAAIRKQMASRDEEQQSTWICYAINSVCLLRDSLSVVNTSIFYRRQMISASKSAVNQNASINKNSKSSNSRNLRQHTSAKSISLCDLCFCFFWEIGRFIILICRYLRDQDSQQDSHSRSFRIYLLSSPLHLLLSNLSLHVYRICFETFSVNHDQTDIWVTVNEFLCNVDR